MARLPDEPAGIAARRGFEYLLCRVLVRCVILARGRRAGETLHLLSAIARAEARAGRVEILHPRLEELPE
jgi:hypothetical protein